MFETHLHAGVCAALMGEVVGKESLGEPGRVSMQQIKADLFHLQISIMKDGYRKTDP